MFKVGDFVYYRDIPEDPNIMESCGYGNIIEIKNISKYYYGEEKIEPYAVIQVKYLADGTQCNYEDKELIAIKMLEKPEYALENKMKNLEFERERLIKMCNQEHLDKNMVSTYEEIWSCKKSAIKEIANEIVYGTHFTNDIESHLKELVKRIIELCDTDGVV